MAPGLGPSQREMAQDMIILGSIKDDGDGGLAKYSGRTIRTPRANFVAMAVRPYLAPYHGRGRRGRDSSAVGALLTEYLAFPLKFARLAKERTGSA